MKYNVIIALLKEKTALPDCIQDLVCEYLFKHGASHSSFGGHTHRWNAFVKSSSSFIPLN